MSETIVAIHSQEYTPVILAKAEKRLLELTPKQALEVLHQSLIDTLGDRLEFRLEGRSPDEGPSYSVLSHLGVPITATHTQISEALKVTELACAPMSAEKLADLMQEIRLTTGGRKDLTSAEDQTRQIYLYARRLREFPADVTQVVLQRDRKWWPALAELVEECEKLCNVRNGLKRKLRDELETPLEKRLLRLSNMAFDAFFGYSGYRETIGSRSIVIYDRMPSIGDIFEQVSLAFDEAFKGRVVTGEAIEESVQKIEGFVGRTKPKYRDTRARTREGWLYEYSESGKEVSYVFPENEPKITPGDGNFWELTNPEWQEWHNKSKALAQSVRERLEGYNHSSANADDHRDSSVFPCPTLKTVV